SLTSPPPATTHALPLAAARPTPATALLERPVASRPIRSGPLCCSKLFRATEQSMLSGISSSTRGLSPVPVRVWLVLCAMSMLQFFIAVDVTVVNIALPSIGADFGVEGHSLTWVVVGYTITGGGLLMLGGRLGDLLGRRRTLLVGTTLFGAASLLAGLAPSFPVLVAA